MTSVIYDNIEHVAAFNSTEARRLLQTPFSVLSQFTFYSSDFFLLKFKLWGQKYEVGSSDIIYILQTLQFLKFDVCMTLVIIWQVLSFCMQSGPVHIHFLSFTSCILRLNDKCWVFVCNLDLLTFIFCHSLANENNLKIALLSVLLR